MNKLCSSIKQFFLVFKKDFYVLGFFFKCCPVMILFASLFIISSVVYSLSSLYLINNAVEYLTKYISSGINAHEFTLIIIKYSSLLIVSLLYMNIYKDYIEQKVRNIYVKKIQEQVFRKVRLIDLEEFDDPTFYNKYTRALRDTQWRAFYIYQTTLKFLTNIIVTIALGSYIIIKDPILLLIIVISSIITLICIISINKLNFKTYKDNEIHNRLHWYVNRVFYMEKYAAEIKTTSISSVLIDKYKDATNSIENNYKDLYKKQTIWEVISSFGTNIVRGCLSYLYLTLSLFGKTSKVISVSSFATLVNATIKFSNSFNTTIFVYADMKYHSLFVDDLMWLINYVPKSVVLNKEIEEFKTLEVNNISFSYKNSNKVVLKNVSFNLNASQHIAIVGLNGSGKSTLTKLLLKLYDVTSGNIYYNGIPYNEINSEVLQRKVGIVFQDYKLYSVSIAENLLLRRVESQDDREKVITALKKVSLYDKVSKFDNGIDTLITREFDKNGAVFSGGELQRLVIARMILSEASMFILDEPTSALDPESEVRINKLLQEHLRNKTVILIAHRLSSVVDMDKIYLLHNGCFIEQGTHKQLMELNKMYASMFNTQKSLYREK